MKIRDAAARSHAGPIRAFNEDATLWLADHRLAAVADGMGGPGFGNVAASVALLALQERAGVLHELGQAVDSHEHDARTRLATGRALEDALTAAHEAVALSSRSRGGSMASTCCAALVAGNRAFLAHVGDSRAYILREGQLKVITEDHTVAMLRYRQGALTAEEYGTSPLRRQLYQSLGAGNPPDVDLAEIELADFDVLLLCTDGLHRALGAERILHTIGSAPSMTEAADQLVALACELGADDNVSVVLVKVGTARASAEIEQVTSVIGSLFLFRDLSEPERAIVAPYLEHRWLDAGEVLFRTGDPGASFFCVVDGTIEIRHGETLLTTVGRGGHLGELTLAKAAPRSATAIATTGTHVFELTRDHFHDIIRRRPSIGARIALAALDQVGDRLRDLTERLASPDQRASSSDQRACSAGGAPR